MFYYDLAYSNEESCKCIQGKNPLKPREVTFGLLVSLASGVVFYKSSIRSLKRCFSSNKMQILWTFRPLPLKIHQLQSTSSKNPLTAECLFGKTTNCEVFVAITYQLQSASSENPLTAVWMDCSLWIFRKSISQSVGYRNQHFAVALFFGWAPRSWWIFIRIDWYGEESPNNENLNEEQQRPFFLRWERVFDFD